MGCGLEEEPTTFQRWQWPLWSGQKGKKQMCELSPALFDTRKLTCRRRQSEFCLTWHTYLFSHWDSLLALASTQPTESRTSQRREKWPHLSFTALTDDEEKKRGRAKGRRLNGWTPPGSWQRWDEQTPPHMYPPLFWTMLLTHQWKTLNSCLFNYANAYIYKWPCLVISCLN